MTEEKKKEEQYLRKGDKKRTVCVVGHKNPDTDSICSAISYAYLKNQTDENNRYVAARAGQVSAETQYILDHFGERGNTTWGTGNGLADLMGTVNRVHASIEVNTELAPEDVFTKEISICFDGKENLNILQKEKNEIPVQGLIPNLE